MSGDFNTAEKTKGHKMAESYGQNKSPSASQSASSSDGNEGMDHLVIEGLDAEHTNIGGRRNYYNRSDQKGDPEMMKQLLSSERKPRNTKLTFIESNVGKAPNIGVEDSYIQESTSGAISNEGGKQDRNRDDDLQRMRLIAYLSGVLKTLPRAKMEKLAEELEDTLEVFVAPDDLLEVDMEKLRGLQTVKTTQKEKFLRHVEELRSKPPVH